MKRKYSLSIYLVHKKSHIIYPTVLFYIIATVLVVVEVIKTLENISRKEGLQTQDKIDLGLEKAVGKKVVTASLWYSHSHSIESGSRN